MKEICFQSREGVLFVIFNHVELMCFLIDCGNKTSFQFFLDPIHEVFQKKSKFSVFDVFCEENMFPES